MRGSGKSWFIRDAMYELTKRKVPYGTVMSKTEVLNSFFGPYFPNSFIYTDFVESRLKMIVKAQEKKIQKKMKQHDYNLDKVRTPENGYLIVMDDMLADDAAWKKSPSLKQLFYNGRHSNVFFLMSLQFPLGIPTGFRGQIDYIVLFANDQTKDLERLWQNYAGVFQSYKQFVTLFKEVTKVQGQALVIVNGIRGELTDKVFVYRSKDPGPFRFGSPNMWAFHDQNHNSDDDTDDDDDDDPKSRRKKTVTSLANTFQAFGNKDQKYYVTIDT